MEYFQRNSPYQLGFINEVDPYSEQSKCRKKGYYFPELGIEGELEDLDYSKGTQGRCNRPKSQMARALRCAFCFANGFGCISVKA